MVSQFPLTVQFAQMGMLILAFDYSSAYWFDFYGHSRKCLVVNIVNLGYSCEKCKSNIHHHDFLLPLLRTMFIEFASYVLSLYQQNGSATFSPKFRQTSSHTVTTRIVFSH